MPLPRYIDIDGRRYVWRDLMALRRAQAQPAAQQPALFTLHEDHRPPAERNAAERYREPSLFTVLERCHVVWPAGGGLMWRRPPSLLCRSRPVKRRRQLA
jgi:hypothetical protein